MGTYAKVYQRHFPMYYFIDKYTGIGYSAKSVHVDMPLNE